MNPETHDLFTAAIARLTGPFVALNLKGPVVGRFMGMDVCSDATLDLGVIEFRAADGRVLYRHVEPCSGR